MIAISIIEQMTKSSVSSIPQSHNLDLAGDFPKSAAEDDLQDELMLMRFLQELRDADVPQSPSQPQFHTGRLPNSRTKDGKPRLLLMGQRR